MADKTVKCLHCTQELRSFGRVQARYETEYFTAYECKHSTYIYLFFITLNSLYVEASGDLFVHYIVNHVLFGLYIQLYAGQVSCLLLQIVFPYVLGDLQQFFLRVGLPPN